MKNSYNEEKLTTGLMKDLCEYFDANWSGDATERLRFAEDNRDHIAFCLKLWFAYGADAGLSSLTDALARNATGVFDLIQRCSDFATDLQNISEEARNTIVKTYAPELDEGEAYNRIYAYARFWNRVALANAPWHRSEGIKKMIRSMNHNRLWDYNRSEEGSKPETSEYKTTFFCNNVLPTLRVEMCYIFGGYKPEMAGWDEFNTSHGATQDSCTNPFCKWLRITLAPDALPNRELKRREKCPSECYTLSEVAQNTKVAVAPDGVHMVNWERSTCTKVYAVAPIVVPKTFKSGRVVCPEKTYYLSWQLYYSKQLIKFWRKRGYLGRFMTTHDQDLTRSRVSREGYCSIDLSSASDTNSRRLLKDCYPDIKVLDQILSVMPTHIQLDSTVVPMNMFGTMGSPMTFPFLTGCTCAKVATGMIWACRLLGFLPEDGVHLNFADLKDRGPSEASVLLDRWESSKFQDKLIHNYVYDHFSVCGDDIVCPEWAYDHVTAVLTMCGDIVNDDKSFTVGSSFREACGFEGFFGVDAQVVYLTRGVIYDKKTLTAATWDSFSDEYKSPLGSLRNLLNVFYSRRYGNCCSVIRDFLEEAGLSVMYDPFDDEDTFHGPGQFDVMSLDLGQGSFPTHMVSVSTATKLVSRAMMVHRLRVDGFISPDAFRSIAEGSGIHIVRSYVPDISVSHRILPILNKGEVPLVSRLGVTWKDAKPKAGCICTELPNSLLLILKERFKLDYFLRFGPFYKNEWEYAHKVSSVDDPTIGFRKRPVVTLK